ncbi:MAG: hypothetical protein QW416_08655 [Candidatus Nitrosocaldaceae archaeon]
MINYAYAHLNYEEPYEEEISCDDDSFNSNGHYYYWYWCDYYYQDLNYKRYFYSYHSWTTQNSVGERETERWYHYLNVKVNSSKFLIYDRYPLANADLTLYKGDKIRYHTNITLIYEELYFDNNYYSINITDGMLRLPKGIAITDVSEDYYDISLNATISAYNIEYGTYDIDGKIYYQYPMYYHSKGYSCSNSCYPFNDEGVKYLSRSQSITLTNVTIVPYAPILKVYPYLSLSSNGDWSFDKQLKLAMHYQGSMDMDGTIHPLRRALINSDYNEEYVYQVLKGYDIVDDYKVKKIFRDDIKYLAYNITCSNPIANTTSVIYAYDNNSDGYHDEFMLTKEGYYELSLYYDASYMLDIINNQYADLTLYTLLKSNFAYESIEIANFTYIYPSRAFNARINITTITDYNNNPTQLVVEKIALNLSRYEYPLYDYLYLKYYRESNDLLIVNSIMCMEDAMNTYLKDYYEATYSSRLIVDALYSELLIPEHSLQFYNASDVFDIPLNYALTTLTPYNITITIIKDVDISNEYILPALQQYSDYVYYANVGNYHFDQYLKRFNNIIYVEPPETFLIRDLYVNKFDENNNYVGSEHYNCRSGCIVTLPEEYSAWILMSNEWQGRADAFVSALPTQTTQAVESDIIVILILASSIALSILICLRKFWNIIY